MDFDFSEEWIFVWLLMSNSELLRIKNEQKTLLKNKRLQAVIKNTINGLMIWVKRKLFEIARKSNNISIFAK